MARKSTSGVNDAGIPFSESVPFSEFGKRSTIFDGKRIRYVEMVDAPYYQSLQINRQNTLALAQYMCNKAHERAMGKDTEIGPVFDWMEQFLTIAATKGFPEMPINTSDAAMWGILGREKQEAFSMTGLDRAYRELNKVPALVAMAATVANRRPPNIALVTFDPERVYDEVFVNNPDPNFKWRVLVRAHGNVWELKYPARYMAIQWMMAFVRYKLTETLLNEPIPSKSLHPSELKPVQNQLKLLREAYSMVEACYAEWVEFLRNSGLLGKYYSPEIEGIVEAPQERRPPPLLEH